MPRAARSHSFGQSQGPVGTEVVIAAETCQQLSSSVSFFLCDEVAPGRVQRASARGRSKWPSQTLALWAQAGALLWPFAAEPKKLSAKAARRVLPVGTAIMRLTDQCQAAKCNRREHLFISRRRRPRRRTE